MDKFRLFYEEILKISLSENPLSQMVKFKTTQDNLRFTNSVMHQLISTQFLGQSFNIESLIVGLKQLALVDNLTASQGSQDLADDLFIKTFSSFFQHIEHLSHVLRFAPPHIKKLQLGLLVEVLLKQDHEHHEAQITNLSSSQIQSIIQQSLEYSADEFSYQQLIHRCIFELLHRSIQSEIKGYGLYDYQTWLARFSHQIDECLKHARLNSQSILDGLELFEHQNISFIDLLKIAEEKFSVNLSYNQAPTPLLLTILQSKRQLLEKLKFGQERRYDYFQKICRNTINDYLTISKDLKEIYLSDNHLSDETFVNLSRRIDVERLLEKINLQNKEPFSDSLLVDELMGIKIYNVGKLNANLPLKNYPFPKQDRKSIQEFILQTKPQVKDKHAQQKHLKKYLEKAQVIAYTLEGESSSEVKFAVRLKYASEIVLNFCLEYNRFPCEEEITDNLDLNLQCLTIRDSKNLDEAVIQNAIRSRESLRIKEMNHQRAILQEQIQTQRKALLLQQQVQYRLTPLENNIQQLKTQKQTLELLAKNKHILDTLHQKLKQFTDNQETITSLYFDIKTRIERIEVLLQAIEKKLQCLLASDKNQKQLGGIYQASSEINPSQLTLKKQQEQIELTQLKLIYSQLEPFIQKSQIQMAASESSTIHVNLAIFSAHLIKQHEQLKLEITQLQSDADTVATIKISEPHLTIADIEQELKRQHALHQKIISLLPNNCYQEFHQLDELEEQFKILSEQLIDKRHMFAAFKDNFPAPKISEIGLNETQERCFRQLLELYSVYQEARIIPPTMIVGLFEQLEQHQFQKIEFPQNMLVLEKKLDKIFIIISEIPLNHELSANLEFSIKRQRAIINEQKTSQNISIIEQYLANLLTTTNPSHLEQIKQALLCLFTNAYHIDILTQLDIENISPNKIQHDINSMLDNLLRIAQAVREGKSFISREEETAYIEVILKVASEYHLEKQQNSSQYLPNFENLGFKLKHSQCMQHVTFYDAQQQSVITISIELEKALPYSLRKFPNGAYFLSYGGSRGVIYQAPHANKRLMSNVRLIGCGQYGNISQASHLFLMTEIAFKHVVSSSLAKEVFDPNMQNTVGLRAIYARPDNLNKDEALINYVYNQAIHIQAPHHPTIGDVKPSLYVQDARAKKISGAQNLALGESLADLSVLQRQNLSKEMQAYHNPCLRANFDLGEQTTQILSQAHAIINAIEKYHRLGFTHGDIKPENIMLYKKPDNRYEACLIDKATSAFQRLYFGNEQDLSVIFEQIFANTAINHQQPDLVESIEGYYVKKQNEQIVFGKKALLQITFGARNCTLPFIAPCMIDDPKSQNATIISFDNKSMDNWAATVLLFGICNQKAYFSLVEGRIVSDYRVPGILKVTGSTPQDLALEIESKALFNKYFACEKSSSVMFVPSNLREGEPWHLYRYLSKISEELDHQTPNTQLSKTKREIQDILHTVYIAIENGTGLTIQQLKNLLFQIEQCKITYEKLMCSQPIAQPINEEQQFEKALRIAQSNESYALRIPIDARYCVLDILCLYAKTPNQISQAKQQLDIFQDDLMSMFIGPNAICHSLLQQCLAMHQQDIALTLIEKIKQQASYPELIEKTQLLRQAAQENLTDVFLALNQPVAPLSSTPFIKWNKSCLEFAIDNHNPKILSAVLASTSLEKDSFLDALRRCSLNDNIDFYQQILTFFNQQETQAITDEDILNHHPISSFHLWITSNRNWYVIDKLNDKNLYQFLTSPENPFLFACQFENLAAVLHIINSKQKVLSKTQWQELLCNKDLENKSVLYHALDIKEKTTDIVELFTYIQKNFDEQQILELLLQPPRLKDFDPKTIYALLAQTKDMPLQQMAIIIFSHHWIMQRSQIAQELLEDTTLLTPQTRIESLAYLSVLEGSEIHFFKSILEKYLPKPSHSALIPIFELGCLFHPKIYVFIEDELINKLKSFQHQYQLQQCKKTLPEIVKQLDTEDKALFIYINKLIQDFQLSQIPIASKIFINQQTLERLNLFCQHYASPTPPKNLTEDFLDIFDTQELKRLLKLQNPKDLKLLSEQFGPIVKIVLKSQLNASDKLLALEQIQHLKCDLQSHLHQIKQAIFQKQLEHFSSNLNEICDTILEKIQNLNSRKHLKAASRLRKLYDDLNHEKNQVPDEVLFNRCLSYFQNALDDKELKTHRHWLLAWIYKLLGLNKPTKTIELLNTLNQKLEGNNVTFTAS